MEYLQNDNKKIKNRKPLKDADNAKVEVNLIDQIPIKLAKKLREENVGQKLVDVYERARAGRQEWLNRLALYNRDIDEFKYTYDYGNELKTQELEGISQLHIPMPLTVIKNVHSRFMQAMTADLSPVVEARRSDSMERAPLVKSLMGYALKDWANYYQGVEETLDQFIWDWCANGSGVLKTRWCTEYDTYQDVGNFVEPDAPKEMVDEAGNIIPIPNVKLSQKEVRRVIKRFDGPMIEARNAEDIIMVGSKDPQRADYVFDTYRLTASELLTFADQKLFDEEEVKEVLKAGPDAKSGRPEDQPKEDRRKRAGDASLDTEPSDARYRILEVYFGYACDDSGINSQLVAWVHSESRRILRATYLYRINKAGERPYSRAPFMLRKDTEHDLGLLEILHPLSIEMDFHHNSRVDFGLFSNMPFGFYRSSSSVNPQKFKVMPGDLIPLEDPANDVFYPNLGNRTSFGIQEESLIQTLVERLTGVNDLSMGVLSGAQGPSRTATGVRGLFQESNTNLDVHLKRLNRAWKQTLRYTLHLLQQRLPEGFEYRLTGEDGQKYFVNIKNRSDIKGDFDFELTPSSATSNPSIQRDRANFVAQLQQNPILLTTGIVTPQNLWEGARQQLVINGIKDWNRYISKPLDYTYVPSPEEEANRVLRGIPVPVLPNSDHQGFISYVQFLMTEDGPNGAPLLAQFSQEEVALLAQQAAAHEQMMASIQEMQAQANNSNQQIGNSLQGIVQANVQLPFNNIG